MKIDIFNKSKGWKKVEKPSSLPPGYYNSFYWFYVRKTYGAIYSMRCAAECGVSPRKATELHHLKYRLWQEHYSDLVPLCSQCHKLLHKTLGSIEDVKRNIEWIESRRSLQSEFEPYRWDKKDVPIKEDFSEEAHKYIDDKTTKA